MEFSSAEISAWVGSLFWPFCRIAGLIMAMPVFSSQTVSPRFRIALAIVLTPLVAPYVQADLPLVDALSVPGGILVAQQVLLGAAAGFIMQLAFQVFILAGQIIAMQTGLGFASLIDPQSGVQVPIVSQIYLMIVSLLFLVMDGHLLMFDLIIQSFEQIPLTGVAWQPDRWFEIATWGGRLFAAGLLLALPATVALLVINISFGIMSKAAPSLNPFSMGFPIALMCGMIMILVTMPGLIPHYEQVMVEAFASVRRLLGL